MRRVSVPVSLLAVALVAWAVLIRGGATAAQDATPVVGGAHPVVGLWQFNGAPDPAQGPRPGFEIYHADGTYTAAGGAETGAASGIWRPTGARTAEVLWVFPDTDPGGEYAPGTATFRATVEVDAACTTLTYSGATIDVRDEYGTPCSRGRSTSRPPPASRSTTTR